MSYMHNNCHATNSRRGPFVNLPVTQALGTCWVSKWTKESNYCRLFVTTTALLDQDNNTPLHNLCLGSLHYIRIFHAWYLRLSPYKRIQFFYHLCAHMQANSTIRCLAVFFQLIKWLKWSLLLVCILTVVHQFSILKMVVTTMPQLLLHLEVRIHMSVALHINLNAESNRVAGPGVYPGHYPLDYPTITTHLCFLSANKPCLQFGEGLKHTLDFILGNCQTLKLVQS